MALGGKQVVGAAAGQTIATAAVTPIGYAVGCGGAKYLVVRARGGNSANALTFTPRCAVNQNVATAVSPALSLTLLAGLAGAGNQAADGSRIMVFGFIATDGANVYALAPIPTHCVQLCAQAATGDVTGVIVEAWPIFETDPKGGAPANFDMNNQ